MKYIYALKPWRDAMEQFRSIEIDFDVHKRIEAERSSFGETPNDVLRRLLKIEAMPPTVASNPPAARGRAWSGKGVTLPPGTELRMEYNGRSHHGRIENGGWLVEGKRYGSPSAAAGGAATTKAGSRPSLDGWIYWRVKRPGDQDWMALNTLRDLAKSN
jgi:hypothetical protein